MFSVLTYLVTKKISYSAIFIFIHCPLPRFPFDCFKSNWISWNAFRNWMSPSVAKFTSDSFHGAKQFLDSIIPNGRECAEVWGNANSKCTPRFGSQLKRAISRGISHRFVLATILVKCRETSARNTCNQNGRYSGPEGVDNSSCCSDECVGPDWRPVWTPIPNSYPHSKLNWT